MDATVALVQAYLQVNGYFTVGEYPILTVNRRGEARAATVIAYLKQYLHNHWHVLHQVKFGNNALEMLALNERMSRSG